MRQICSSTKGSALQLMTHSLLGPFSTDLRARLIPCLSCFAAMYRNLRLRKQQLLAEKLRAADLLTGFIRAVHEAQQRTAIAAVSGACVAVFDATYGDDHLHSVPAGHITHWRLTEKPLACKAGCALLR